MRYRFKIVEGRCEAVSAPDTVRAVVLHEDDREVRRIEVRLRPGEVDGIGGRSAQLLP